MAVTRSTLALTRRLRADIGTEADSVDRHLTGQWVTAWDDLERTWASAINALVAKAVADGAWPNRNQIARSTAMDALEASSRALDRLAETTATTAIAGARAVIDADVDLEPRIIASQAPESQQEALEAYIREQDEEPEDGVLFQATVAGMVAGRIDASAIAAIFARTEGRVTADTWPLSAAATEAMKLSLIRGVTVGDNPEDAARDMLSRVQGAFEGGLTRAMTISRTEMLDAYRSACAYIHRANADVVNAWEWFARLDSRTCPACWGRHGKVFPLSDPGPDDHPNGRCTRLPVLKPWAELGITATEPPSMVPDAQTQFFKLPRADQLEVMGPGRLALLDSGDIGWDDLATWRNNPSWRRSNQPATVTALKQLAQEESRVS